MSYEEKIKTARYLARVFFEYEEGIEISEKPQDLSWDYVYGMAKRHSLPALFFELLGARAKAEAPEALYKDWQRDAMIAGAKHISQKAALESISKAFTEKGIAFLPLKGFLIKKLYKNPALREMTDIDIFVGEENIEKAKSALLELGYNADMSLEVHDSFKKPLFLEIELHKILHLDIKDYSFENSLPSQENVYHRLMTEEDFLIFLLHHAKKHDETGGAGIRTVFDFYLLFKAKNYDENSIIERIKKEKLLDFYNRLKNLIAFWFEGAEATRELLDFEVYTVTGGTYGNLENAYLRRGKKKNALRLVLERVFPPYSLMSSRYPILKKCPILLPFFYPIRLVASLFNGSARKNMKALSGAGKKRRELEKLSQQNENSADKS